jgi:hypothetical protein
MKTLNHWLMALPVLVMAVAGGVLVIAILVIIAIAVYDHWKGVLGTAVIFAVLAWGWSSFDYLEDHGWPWNPKEPERKDDNECQPKV